MFSLFKFLHEFLPFIMQKFEQTKQKVPIASKLESKQKKKIDTFGPEVRFCHNANDNKLR